MTELPLDQVTNYRQLGYALLPGYFDESEVAVIRRALAETMSVPSPSRVMEQDGAGVRSIYGSHARHAVFNCLVRHPRIVLIARQLLEGDVYVHQFKVNTKAAFGGDLWEWHQDFIYWHHEDGMPLPRVINVLVFLDEVTEFNGPLLLIPKSHLHGMISPAAEAADPMVASGPESWARHVSADLKYTLDKELIRRLVSEHGIVAPKGVAGSVLLFDPNICHASATNMSPYDRRVAIVTYNHIANRPTRKENLRPEFLSARDCEAISVVRDAALLEM